MTPLGDTRAGRPYLVAGHPGLPRIRRHGLGLLALTTVPGQLTRTENAYLGFGKGFIAYDQWHKDPGRVRRVEGVTHDVNQAVGWYVGVVSAQHLEHGGGGDIADRAVTFAVAVGDRSKPVAGVRE
jgi:hypothetical protein